MKGIVPGVPEVVREALIVIAGAALAAFVVSRFPKFKQWVKDSWQ